MKIYFWDVSEKVQIQYYASKKNVTKVEKKQFL